MHAQSGRQLQLKSRLPAPIDDIVGGSAWEFRAEADFDAWTLQVGAFSELDEARLKFRLPTADAGDLMILFGKAVDGNALRTFPGELARSRFVKSFTGEMKHAIALRLDSFEKVEVHVVRRAGLRDFRSEGFDLSTVYGEDGERRGSPLDLN